MAVIHDGIRSNEMADFVVNSDLDLPQVKFGVFSTECKHHIRQLIVSTWTDVWNGAIATKLH